MPISDLAREQLVARFEVLLPYLNERQQRLALAAEARLLGHGGVRVVARIAGVSETTVRKGVFELERGADPLPIGRVRSGGGGRKPATELDPMLLSSLLALVEPDERGDPMSPLRWTTKSLRSVSPAQSRCPVRTRPLDAGSSTFLATDALVLKLCQGGRVVNVHALGSRQLPAGQADRDRRRNSLLSRTVGAR